MEEPARWACGMHIALNEPKISGAISYLSRQSLVKAIRRPLSVPSWSVAQHFSGSVERAGFGAKDSGGQAETRAQKPEPLRTALTN